MLLHLDFENFKTNIISSRWVKDVGLVLVVRGKGKTSEVF